MTLPRTPGPTLIHATVLTTERLILRAPEAADFEPFATFWASDRSRHIHGPLDRTAAWRIFAAHLGHWLLRGYGLFQLLERETGARIGYAGFWNPEGWAEPELAWALYAGGEGRGLAREAAIRLRAYASEVLDWGPLASLIPPENDRSIALAESLGARLEREWQSPAGNRMLIYRHLLPEAA